jgi:hypothetical protein
MDWKWPTVLGDEELSQEIQFALVEKAKGGYLNATILIDIILSPAIQAQLGRAGIDRPSISVCRSHCWLARLGWQYGKQWNGMYIDGHKLEDIVEYRQKFVD